MEPSKHTLVVGSGSVGEVLPRAFEEELLTAAQVEDTQDNSYDSDARRERFGNNRKHAKKHVSRAKRKAAKVSKRRNRT